MKKRFLTLFMTMILLICFGTNAYAALPETVEPLWDNIQSIIHFIDFNGNTGNSTADIYGKSGTTNITGTLNVYKQTTTGWVLVGHDYDSTTTRDLTLYVEFDAEPGAYYQSVLNFSVTINGVVEPETLYEFATCPTN